MKKISKVLVEQRPYDARPFALINHVHPAVYPPQYADVTERDAITGPDRYEGVIVYLVSDQTTYQLRGGITNDDWETLVTAGGVTSHTQLGDIGTNTHPQIDTAISTSAAHIADSTIHFNMAAISITESQISDLGPYADASHNHDLTYLGINATADAALAVQAVGFSATPPSTGYVPVATGATTAEWQPMPNSAAGINQTGTPLVTHIGYFTADKTLTGESNFTWTSASSLLSIIGTTPKISITDSDTALATMLGSIDIYGSDGLAGQLGFISVDGVLSVSAAAGDVALKTADGSLVLDAAGDTSFSGSINGFAGSAAYGEILTCVSATSRAEFTAAPMGIIDNSTGVAGQIVVFDGPASAIGSTFFTWDTVALTAGAFIYDNFTDKMTVGDGTEATAGQEINSSATGNPYINLKRAGSTVAVWRYAHTASRLEVSCVSDNITLRPGNVDTMTLTQALLSVVGGVTLGGTLTSQAGRLVNTTRVASTYPIVVTDRVVLANTDAGTFIATLPVGAQGQSLRIVNTGTSGILLTVAPNGAELLFGVSANFTLFDGEALELVYDTTDGWY
jgi:hypothetical protein